MSRNVGGDRCSKFQHFGRRTRFPIVDVIHFIDSIQTPCVARQSYRLYQVNIHTTDCHYYHPTTTTNYYHQLLPPTITTNYYHHQLLLPLLTLNCHYHWVRHCHSRMEKSTIFALQSIGARSFNPGFGGSWSLIGSKGGNRDGCR